VKWFKKRKIEIIDKQKAREHSGSKFRTLKNKIYTYSFQTHRGKRGKKKHYLIIYLFHLTH